MHLTSTRPTPRASGPQGLKTVLGRFEPANPKMLNARALLRRTDTKFLVPDEQIIWLLANVTRDYLIVPSGDRTLSQYRTVYFDTPDLRCFNDHRRGRRPRHKVRIRHYLDRQLSYFEIKTKNSNDMTSKVRLPRAFGDESYGEAEQRVVARHTGLPARDLEPSVTIDFGRIMLLGKYTEERITIDVELEFTNAVPGFDMRGASVVEVKQLRLDRTTPFMRILRAQGARPRSSSKYCTAMALGQRGVRTNRVQPVLRALERIQK